MGKKSSSAPRGVKDREKREELHRRMVSLDAQLLTLELTDKKAEACANFLEKMAVTRTEYPWTKDHLAVFLKVFNRLRDFCLSTSTPVWLGLPGLKSQVCGYKMPQTGENGTQVAAKISFILDFLKNIAKRQAEPNGLNVNILPIKDMLEFCNHELSRLIRDYMWSKTETTPLLQAINDTFKLFGLTRSGVDAAPPDDGYAAGYEDGLNDGLSEGHIQGSKEAYEAGRKVGYEEAWAAFCTTFGGPASLAAAGGSILPPPVATEAASSSASSSAKQPSPLTFAHASGDKPLSGLKRQRDF